MAIAGAESVEDDGFGDGGGDLVDSIAKDGYGVAGEKGVSGGDGQGWHCRRGCGCR